MKIKLMPKKKNQYSWVLDETINNDPNSKSNVQTSDKTMNTKHQITTGMKYMQNLPITAPLRELENYVGVLIRQIPQVFEALNGCEMENIYHIYGSNVLLEE